MPSGVPSVGAFKGLKAFVASLPKARAFPLGVAALAVLLGLPALGTGLILDDFYHREVLRGESAYRDLLGPPEEMFRFFRGDPARTGRIMDIGAFPWWTDPTLKAEFLQAITVLTHRLDYALWPDSPALMHAQSLFWLGTAVAAAAVFYRRMLGATWVAAVAALLFAVDDARGTTVGFIANRNVLIAATFGFMALVFHDRYRRGGSRPAAFLAPLLLAAGTLFQGGRHRNVCLSRRVCLIRRPERPMARLSGDLALCWGRRGLAGSACVLGLWCAKHGSLRRPADGSLAIRGGRVRTCAPDPLRPVVPDSGRSRGRAAAASFEPVLVGGRRLDRPSDPSLRTLAQTRSTRSLLGRGHALRHDSSLCHLADGPALDVRRLRRIRPARSVLGVCVRQVDERPDLSRMANPRVCTRLVFRGRPRGLGAAHFSSAHDQSLGTLVGRGSSLRPRAAGTIGR